MGTEHSFAAEKLAHIKLEGERSALRCTLEEPGSGYVCEKGGRKVLVYALPTVGGKDPLFQTYSAVAWDRTKPEELKSLFVDEIRDGKSGELIFSAGDPEEKRSRRKQAPPPPFTSDSLAAQVELAPYRSIFESRVIQANEPSTDELLRRRGGKKFEAILAEFRQRHETSKAALGEALKGREFELALEDGQRASCTRAQSRTQTATCSIFKCGPVTYQGRKRELSVLMPLGRFVHELSAPITLVADEQEGFVDSVKVRSLHARGVSKPVLGMNPAYEKHFRQAEKALTELGILPNSFSLHAPLPQQGLGVLESLNAKAVIDEWKQDCVETDQPVQFLLNQFGKYREGIALREVVQLIDADSYGFSSRWVRPGELGDEPCFSNGLWFTPEAAPRRGALATSLESERPKAISRERAEELFRSAAAMDELAWNYRKDGCYARAHLMARKFQSEGIDAGKVWIRGELSPETPSDQEPIQWSYHVAPTVYVRGDDGEVTRMVIDPALATRPITVTEWSSRMGKMVVGPDVVTAFPFPDNVLNFERTAIAFSSAEPYVPNDPLAANEEDKLSAARQTLKDYREVNE